MKPVLVIRAAIVLAVLLSPASAQSESKAQRWLRDRIAKLARDSRISPAKVGVAVAETKSGKQIVQHNAAQQFNVASNVKLATAAAALSMLGPEYRFKTALYIPRRPRPSRRRRGRSVPIPVDRKLVEGHLYLKGFGSPTLTEKDLWQLARDLHDHGVRKITGQLIIDETYFDRQKTAPLYDSKATDAWYRPPNGAISINSNVVTVLVRPGTSMGDPATVLLWPRSSNLKLDNRAMTVARARRSWIQVESRPRRGQTEVLVKGRVRLNYRGRFFRRRIEDPGTVAGHALLQLLKRRGIRITPRVSRGKVPDKMKAVAWHTSEPLAVIVRKMNKRSNNFIAEQLLKVLGAEVYGQPATWPKGLKAVARHLRSIGIREGSYTMKNGSGLYDSSRFTPAQIVEILRRSSRDFKIGPEFVASLSQAGADGTLEHRFVGTGCERYLRAKTGTLARVVTLSGLVGASKRRPLAFSILLNDLPERRVIPARAVADEIAEAIVTYLER